MPTLTYHHPLFGDVVYETDHDNKVIGDGITFISGFNENDVQDIYIPELSVIIGNGSTFPFHIKGHYQLKAAFTEIGNAGLIHIIKEFDSPFSKRLRKPTNGAYSDKPSNHAFGIAIDINPNDGSNGGSSSPLAPIFINNGFTWGKTFSSPDPMHYEINQFII